MEKNYVSLEIAKILKEKGFDEFCEVCYHFSRNENKHELLFSSSHFKNSSDEDKITAPTLYTVHKWLVKMYGIYIVVKPHYSVEYEIMEFEYEIYNYVNVVIEKAKPIKSEEYYEDYFQCLSDAILEALKLI